MKTLALILVLFLAACQEIELPKHKGIEFTVALQHVKEPAYDYYFQVNDIVVQNNKITEELTGTIIMQSYRIVNGQKQYIRSSFYVLKDGVQIVSSECDLDGYFVFEL